MLKDKFEAVESIFNRHIACIDFLSLESKSIRNSLLAHYLIEYLPASTIVKTLRGDCSATCIPKLAVADETIYCTRKSIIYLGGAEGKNLKASTASSEAEPDNARSTVDESGKVPIKTYIGRCYPASSLNKIAFIGGIKIFREMCSRHDLKKTIKNNPKKTSTSSEISIDSHIRSLLSEHPIFKDISSGANPQQAAWCYLRLMGGFTETHEGYEKRMESAHSVGDLRKLLGFKIYNDRTVLASIREENIANLLDTAQPMENVFLQTIVNWNKDYLMRLEK